MVNKLTDDQIQRLEKLTPQQRENLYKWIEEQWQTENFKNAIKERQNNQDTVQQPNTSTQGVPSNISEPTQPTEVKTTPAQTQEVREAPTQTEKVNTTQQKETPKIDSNIINDAFEVGAARWLDIDETISNIKKSLEKKGISTENFEAENQQTIERFSSFDNSPDTFFAWLQAGESYNKVVQKSPSYLTAQKRFDSFNSINKTETGLKNALKSWKLNKDSVLYKDLMDVPEYASILNEARKVEIEEKIKNTKDISDLTFEEFDVLIQGKIDKYTLDVEGIENDLKTDEVLNENREGYSKAASELSGLYKERDNIRSNIDAKYPNWTQAFKAALYNRETSAINDKIAEKTEEASLYQNNYNLRLWEKELVYNLEQTKSGQQLSVFNQLLSTYNTERSVLNQKELIEFQTQQTIYQSKEMANIARQDSNKDVISWQYDNNGNLLWLNQEWATIVTKSWLEKTSSSEDYTVVKRKRVDGGEDIYVLDKDWNLSRKSTWVDWEWLVIENWATNQWAITSYWNRVDWDYWLDIAVEKWTPINSPFNWEILEVGYDNAFWNYVIMKDENDNKMRIWHLDEKPNLNVWQVVWIWTTIWLAWNSWYVLTGGEWNWREPTQEELNNWLGSHLDITTWRADWTVRNWYETKTFLDWGEASTSKYTQWDINKTLAKIPTQLKNSELEWEKYKEIAIEALNKYNWDISSAVLDVAGWHPTYNKDIVNNLEPILKTQNLWEDFDYAWVSWSISSSDESIVWNSIQRIESAVIANNPETSTLNFSNKTKTDNVVRKVNWLLSTLEEKLWEDNFGKWDGTLENAQLLLSDVTEEWYDFTKFKADVESLFWPIRVESFGVNLTDWEKEYLQSFVPSVTDSKVSITAKLNSLKQNTLSWYNSARRTTWLQPLNEEQLLDSKLLVNLYKEDSDSPIWEQALSQDFWEEEISELDNIYNE